MKFDILIMNFMNIITNIILIVSCIQGYRFKKRWNAIILDTILILLMIIFEHYFHYSPFIKMLLKLIILILFTIVTFHKKLLWSMHLVIFTYAVEEILHLLIALTTFPIIKVLGIQIHTWQSVVVKIFMQAFLLAGVSVFFHKKLRQFFGKITIEVQIGSILISSLIMFSFMKFRSMRYDFNNIFLYNILLFVIIIASMIMVFWLIDKKQEQIKIRELTSYAHKIQEVIPSMSRVLDKLESMSSSEEHIDEANQIINELRSICHSSQQTTCKEIAQIKTFDSTGSIVLDEQLQSYLEEAVYNEFNLDIIVMAPVNDIMDSKQIDCYQLLQMVGDLYRNAFKIIEKGHGQGNILICFGYNSEGNYEISFYDNGAPFTRYILEHLGERGITINGTGHGLADIFEILKSQRGSFVLEQGLGEKSIFTKGIRIIFDRQKRVEINVR